MKNASEKILYIVSGVNGAGKSTFAKTVVSSLKYTYLNADEMAYNISGDYSTEANRAAGREVLNILKENAKQGKPIIWETTLGSKTYFNICKLYKSHEYQIDLTYIFLEDEATHHKRIAERVANGGHAINEGVLMKRFNNRVENFDNAIKIADSWKMFCNQTPWMELVASGHGSAKMILNYGLYEHFCENPPTNPLVREKFKQLMGFKMPGAKKKQEDQR